MSFELKYRETRKSPLITYNLSINEEQKGPLAAEEWLQWRRQVRGRPFRFLDFKLGKGEVLSGETPDNEEQRVEEFLESPEMLAVSRLGQLAKHPRVVALRQFITGWYLSYLSAESARGFREAGPQERLSESGDNLPNVIQFLKKQHPDMLRNILNILSARIPRLENVDADIKADGRLLLQIKDAPFKRPILAKFASDGTLKMLAYLILLYDPYPPQLIGVEEPENYLHPRLLPALTEECRKAASKSQVLVSTHSPFFINELKSDELWVLYRDELGHTQAKRTADMPGIGDLISNGAKLGDLWMENHFNVGDPLTNSGGPIQTELPFDSRNLAIIRLDCQKLRPLDLSLII